MFANFVRTCSSGDFELIQRCQITRWKHWEGSLPFRKGGLPPPAGCMPDCSGSDKMGLAFYATSQRSWSDLITHTARPGILVPVGSFQLNCLLASCEENTFFFGQTRRNAVRFWLTERWASAATSAHQQQHLHLSCVSAKTLDLIAHAHAHSFNQGGPLKYLKTAVKSIAAHLSIALPLESFFLPSASKKTK